MRVAFSDEVFEITRDETELDSFVAGFVRLLEEAGIRYVLVSGYVAILFGRSRNSEDVDIFVEKIGREKFRGLWDRINSRFESIITPCWEDAFDNYLSAGLAVRFARKGVVIPNVELRFPRSGLDFWTLSNAVTASLNGRPLKISPLELQIAYKLYLGSDKDFEDARHLWLVSRGHLNEELLNEFVKAMKQEKNARRWLK